MTTFGVTGHQGLAPDVEAFVKAAVRDMLSPGNAAAIVSSLADGADQLVADQAIAAGAQLHAVVPCRRYRESFHADTVDAFDRLLAAASDIVVLDFDEPSEAAFWAAGQLVAYRCDVLIAVWDGEPSRGLGGTADVVRYARAHDKDVRVIWPDGAVR